MGRLSDAEIEAYGDHPLAQLALKQRVALGMAQAVIEEKKVIIDQLERVNRDQAREIARVNARRRAQEREARKATGRAAG